MVSANYSKISVNKLIIAVGVSMILVLHLIFFFKSFLKVQMSLTFPSYLCATLSTQSASPQTKYSTTYTQTHTEAHMRTCALADDLHHGGREVAHSIISCSVVMDAAFPASVGMLLQNLFHHHIDNRERFFYRSVSSI